LRLYRLEPSAQLDAALEALARGNCEIAIGVLRQIDRDLASRPDAERPTATKLVCEALSEHAGYFNEEQSLV
jgi:hypothetical protein